MFLKQYKVKSNTPLKGSEVKHLRQLLEKSFPNVSSEQLHELLPSKSSVSMLKITTHHDFHTKVFCVDKLPMFFEMANELLAPTLYTMWQIPELLPYLTTSKDVLPRLANGADLMLPGVVPLGTGMRMYGNFKKDQLMAINLTTNTAAAAIGTLSRSSDDLYMSGGHGSAVKILHLFGDKLWSHEPLLTQQLPNLKPTSLTKSDFPAIGEDPKRKPKSVINDESPVKDTAEGSETVASLTETVSNLSELEITESDEPTTIAETALELQPEDILKQAFLAAIKNHGKSLQLPLLTSNFYRLYVVPETPEHLDLKKTIYKKLSNFLNQMVEEGFIVVREESKGVDKITSIDLNHPEVVNFITDVKPPSAAADNDSQDQPLFHSELVEMYIVTDVTAPLFTKLNYKRGEGIPSSQLKKVIREYVSKQNLVIANTMDKTFKLDEALQNICGCAEATQSRIYEIVRSEMDHSYQMCSIKDVFSNKPMIQMSLATRSGNKKVTLVSNVECYGIILSEFIKLCKQGAAASTTIIKLPNQKREQLQIQGNQIRFIYNLLTETYKVPPKCIQGLELAKDAKKKKK